MKKKFDRALSIAIAIPPMTAQSARAYRPKATPSMTMPMSRWIQPQALTSRSNV